MTKLKTRNSNPNIQNKGVIIKIESNYNKPSNDFTKQNQTTLTIDSQDESNGTNMLCIEDCTVSETVSQPISLNITDTNPSIPQSIENGEAVRVEECSEKTLSGPPDVKVKQRLSLNFPAVWGWTSVCGRRVEMEDSVIALPQFLRIPCKMLGDDGSNLRSVDEELIGHVFGVYDGHGGCEVANYCRDRLHLVLAEEIGIAKENRHIKPSEELWMRVFLNCFKKMDDEVGGYPIVVDGDIASSIPTLPPIAPDSVGSTAVVAVVCSSHIVVANCGDSRAVLCRGKVPVPLSVDHKPNREDECTRIEAAGGKVINWNGYRVSGFLAVSRSIGDRYLRPYVIADPEVTFVPRVKEDECLILASDGLWDVITNEEACDLARRRLLLWHKTNGHVLSKERGNEIDPAAQDAADYLSQLAFRRGSRDNISVIVIDLKAQRKFKKKT